MPKFERALILAAVALPLLQCAHGDKPSPTSAASPPKAAAAFDFKAEMAKEATDLVTQPLVAPDQSFRAAIDARRPPEVKTEGDAISILADVGARSALDCVVLKRRTDAGQLLSALVQAPLEKMPRRELQDASVAVDGDRPHMTLNVLYLTDDQKAGLLKSTVVVLPAYTVACRHDELGYVQTTRAATLQLARTLVPATKGPTPRFHAVTIHKVANRPFGFSDDFVLDSNEGGVVEISYGARMAKRDGGTVAFEDEVAVVTTDKAGFVNTSEKITARAGVATTKLKLTRQKGTHYVVEGENDGKPVQGAFDTKAPLPGMRRAAGIILAHARGKARELSTEEWVPSRNPIEVTVLKHTRQADSTVAAPRYRVSDGTLNADLLFDQTGLHERLTAMVNELPFEMIRQFVQGAP